MTLPRGLLHGLVPGSGLLATAAEVLFFGAILLAAFALVMLSERSSPLFPDKVLWGTLIVGLPVLGPLAFLARRWYGGAG